MDKPSCLVAIFLQDGSGLKYFEWAGTSDMTKPINPLACYGCLFHEVDTAILWAYAPSTQTWYKQLEMGGGE